MSLARRVGRAIAWGQAGRLAETGIYLIFYLFLARALGPAGYGQFALGMSLAGACGFLALLGLGPETLGRFLPEVSAAGRCALRKFLGALLSLRCAALLVVGGTFFALEPAIAALLRSSWLAGALALLMAVFASRSVLDLVTYFSAGLLELRRVASAKVVAALATPATFAAIAWRDGASARAAWLATAAGSVAGILVLAASFLRKSAESTPPEASPGDFHAGIPLGRVLAFGMFAWATNFFLYVLGDNTDVLLLGWLARDRASIGVYAVGAKIVFSMASLLLGWTSLVSVASLAEARREGGDALLSSLLEAQWKLGALCLIGPLLFVARYAHAILSIFYSPAYASGAAVIQILAGLMACTVAAGFSLGTSALYAAGRERRAAALVGVAAVFNLAAEIPLVRFTGIRGAAWATGLSFLLLALSSAVAARRWIAWRAPVGFAAKLAAAAALALIPSFWLPVDSVAALAAGAGVWAAGFIAALAWMKPLTHADAEALARIHVRLGRLAARLAESPAPSVTRGASNEPAIPREPATRPLISIAIPTYNRGALLEETLASLLPQVEETAENDVEVVVLDTGSGDGTRGRVEQLSRRHALGHASLRFFATPGRHNLDDALLMLLDVCRGEYVWFFSSDDLLKSGAIPRVRDEIVASRERPALVYVNQQIVDESGRVLIASQVACGRDREFPDARRLLPFLGFNLGFISASVFRRPVLSGVESARQFSGTRSLNLHLYLRALVGGGPAHYIAAPLILARRASGHPPYRYAHVFVEGLVKILHDARRRGFSRWMIFQAMQRVILETYLPLVVSWRADDPAELARTFPPMARACWPYPAFLVLLAARCAPPGILRAMRDFLRARRSRRNERLRVPEERLAGQETRAANA